ncbi:hypothetical protein [Gottfriedia sp. OAE603]|uniref:flagellar biosynthesis protein FlhF n=1 Tax=Gottfriedia sp. OAE603 TaxID=2663872 RepID=UPI00348E1EAC
MRVKKIIAPTMAEAMKKVTEELGHDAVILNSRVIQEGGVFGFFAKKKIELIAALDQNQAVRETTTQKEQAKTVSFQSQIDDLVPLIKEDEIVIPKKQKTKEDLEHENLLNEMKQLKSMITKMSNEQSGEESLHPLVEELKNKLLDQDILEELTEEFILEIKPRMALLSNQVSKEQINEWLKSSIMTKMQHIEFGHKHDDIRYVNVVGPTGVGKTTTLAKIAAEAVLKYRKKSCFYYD